MKVRLASGERLVQLPAEELPSFAALATRFWRNGLGAARVWLWTVGVSTAVLYGLTGSSTALADDSRNKRAAIWLGEDGAPLPFQSDAEVVEFLSEAEVVATKELTTGINRPLKMRLARGSVEANAIFRVVDIRSRRAKLDGVLVADFQDRYIFECAAYRLSVILGIKKVPPCVERSYKGRKGSVQLWIESAQTEVERRASKEDLVNIRSWLRDKQVMRVFDALIFNFDRNQGNMLTDSFGKLWFIDHTRSFRNSARVDGLERIVWCEEEVWEKLKRLDRRILNQELGGYLRPAQIKMILKRRDKIVDYIEDRIGRFGRDSVIYKSASNVSPSQIEDAELYDDIPVGSSVPVFEGNP